MKLHTVRTGFKPATYLLALLLLTAVSLTAQTTHYVRQGGAGNSDGSSWDNASGDLQAMINGASDGDAIYVAAGVYLPTHSANSWTPDDPTGVNDNPDDRNNAFVLKSGVRLYGGFNADTPEDAPEKRTLTKVNNTVQMAYPSVLSGNIGAVGNSGDNSRHVVIAADITDALLDGFTLTGAQADGENGTGDMEVNGQTVYGYIGGGFYNVASTVTLTYVHITGNWTRNHGGGMTNRSASAATLTHVQITENAASNNGNGGGIYNLEASTVTMTNVHITGNNALYGGGITNDNTSTAALTNVQLTGNRATISGSGLLNAGTATLTNVTVADNYGLIAVDNYGGGLWNTGSLTVRNSIIWGNTVNVHSVNGT